MLRCALKMVFENKFGCRLIYVGKKRGKVPADLEAKHRAATHQQLLLEIENADFGMLFREIDCFVVHGGLGTTVEALRTGRPVMVTGPLLLDQRFWGQICADKGLGPEAVHIDAFEQVCVDFVDGALDPDDPSGWQARARETSWGDIDDDGVATNVEKFHGLLEKVSRHELRVRVAAAEDLGKEEVKLGLAAQALVPRALSGSTCRSVYAELQVRGWKRRTGKRLETVSDAGRSVDFSSEAQLVLPYAGEPEVVLSVHVAYGASLNEDALVGSAALPLDGAYGARSAELRLTRSAAHAGSIRLHYEVVDRERADYPATLVAADMCDVSATLASEDIAGGPAR